jgi:2-polyprenyl-3-methyl-5-hydroxy-6-metoxy-1,4-benzoquinol methylase
VDSTDRAKVAAEFVWTGARVLEIGSGVGRLRTLIADRCDYTGADLVPLDEKTLVLDLDNDPMPRGSWDIVVLLEVLEYLHHPQEALRKIASAAKQLVISYCCQNAEHAQSADARSSRGWVSSLTEESFANEVATLGFNLSDRQLFQSTPDFDEIVFRFTK